MGSKQRSGKKQKQRRMEENSKAVESTEDTRHNKQHHKHREGLEENNYSLKTENTNNDSLEVGFQHQCNIYT